MTLFFNDACPFFHQVYFVYVEGGELVFVLQVHKENIMQVQCLYDCSWTVGPNLSTRKSPVKLHPLLPWDFFSGFRSEVEHVQRLTDEQPFFITISKRGHCANFPENERYPNFCNSVLARSLFLQFHYFVPYVSRRNC